MSRLSASKPSASAGSRAGTPRLRPAAAVSMRVPDGSTKVMRIERVIGVLRHAAALARGVVGQDAAERAGAPGSPGSGPIFLPNDRRREVDLAAEHARLHPHARAVVEHLERTPVPLHLDEDAVGDRLAGQARARSPERQRHADLVREREQRPHLLDVAARTTARGMGR